MANFFHQQLLSVFYVDQKNNPVILYLSLLVNVVLHLPFFIFLFFVFSIVYLLR